MEVPVAVPLRVPSSEERRRYHQNLDSGYADESDIGVGISSAPGPREFDLLGFSPPRSQLPSVVRLGMPASKKPIRVETNDGGDESDRASQHSNGGFSGAQSIRSDTGPRPIRVSYESGVASRDGRNGRPRDFGRGRRNSHTVGFPSHFYDDDGGDGDLGYSAVTGSEGASRKVISERLEAVKSRNPVFTWC